MSGLSRCSWEASPVQAMAIQASPLRSEGWMSELIANRCGLAWISSFSASASSFGSSELKL